MGLGQLSAAPLPRSFFDRPSHEVAPDLLGRVLVHGPVAVRLTEVEAYGGPGEDPAAHTYRGRTPRNAVMFGPPGHLYVYFTYGMHFCANLVCLPEGHGSAVLVRAGEIVAGLDEARTRRSPGIGRDGRDGPGRRVPDRDLARGPARLAVALGLLREHNGLDAIWEGAPAALDPLTGNLGRHGHGSDHATWLTGLPHGSAAVLEGRPADPGAIRSGPRTGVSTAKETPWRFWIDGDPTVSPYRAHVPRRRSSAATSVGETPSS
ncbi:DNA-3-methyladenine glycosylase [Nonomuraea sp. NPDC049684]|uniref:DNA-3-methyladenine glycosylase n=1 Tax=Nonomuraea sp. NPDC049684 TaxID=3364356 RepID=UPI0037A83290